MIPSQTFLVDSPEQRVIQISFEQDDKTKSIKRLVEVTNPTEEQPTKTDNIAEQNSLSSGPQIIEGDKSGPVDIEKSEFDSHGDRRAQTEMAKVEKKVLTKKRLEPADRGKSTNIESYQYNLGDPIEVVKRGEMRRDEAKSNESETKIDNEQEKENGFINDTEQTFIQRNAQGRVYNQVREEGVLGFEALRNEIAPYLREIQRKVERYWIHYLLTRYSGVKPTEAVIDCEINRDGKIVKLEGIGVHEDPFFLGLCKQALKNASPFPPFPFQVPDIYQNRNLKIRWTFNFMK